MKNTDFIPITEFFENVNERFHDESDSDPVKDMGIGTIKINFGDIANQYLKKFNAHTNPSNKVGHQIEIIQQWCTWLATLKGKIISGNFKYKYFKNIDDVFEDSLKIIKIDSYGFGGPGLRIELTGKDKDNEVCFILMNQTYFVTGTGLSENVNESELIDYMKQVAGMFKEQRQSDYWQWKVDNAKELKHVSTSEIREKYPQIDAYLKNSRHNVVQKECYKNAGQLCTNVEGVSYVEGEISYHGIPIEHAWNKIDGKYFDITKDVLFSKNSDYAEYVALIELDFKEYSRMILKHKHWGGFVHEKYVEEKGKKSVLESSKMDNYYEKNFGIIHGYNTQVINSYNVVTKIGKYKTPIMQNPKSLEGFDPDVRAISDQEGNLYVAYKHKYFNHGDMANALIKASVIDTIVYNQEDEENLRGVYEDQNHFLLFDRLEDEDIFVPSDTFEWQGTETDKLLKAVKEKNPQFKFDIRYFEDEDDYDLDDNDDEISEGFHYPKLFESPDHFRMEGYPYSTDDLSYAFEVVWDVDNEKILDVLVSNKKNASHGDDDETKGFWRGGPEHAINNKTKPYGVNWKKAYPGRLFMEPKVITFWVYPSNKELKQIVNIIEEKKNIKIYDNDWKIEIYREGMQNKGEHNYENNYQRNLPSEIIPIEKYIGSKKPPEKEYLQHLDTKTKHNVPYGFGSKNPAYMGKRQWQMASLTDEGKDEGFYPKLDLK